MKKKGERRKTRTQEETNKEKVGFIFECGRDGADHQVCDHLLGRLNAGIEMSAKFMDNAERLIHECGEVAAELLKECTRVVILWDLQPTWGGVACRHEDKEEIFKSLKAAKVDLKKVSLICVEQELECWLMADRRAVGTVIGKYKHPHPLGQIPDFKYPDNGIKRPKTALISLFQRELGKGRKYVDRTHAILIARAVPDWSKIRRSDSFSRFAKKAARVSLS